MKLRGFEDVKKAIRDLPENVQNNVARGTVLDIARVLGDDVAQGAPVDEGILRDNVIAVRRRGARGQSRASVMIRTEGKADEKLQGPFRPGEKPPERRNPRNAFYWRFLEYGTRFMSPRRFIRPVFDGIGSRIDSLLTQFATARTERALRKLGR